MIKTHVLAAAAIAALGAPLAAQPAPPSTRAGVEQRIAQRFAARDSNHDGFLAAAELGDGAAMAMAQLDSDHDGKISLAETSNAMLALFDSVDTDHDGAISPAERTAAEARVGQPQPQPQPAPAPEPAPEPS